MLIRLNFSVCVFLLNKKIWFDKLKCLNRYVSGLLYVKYIYVYVIIFELDILKCECIWWF